MNVREFNLFLDLAVKILSEQTKVVKLSDYEVLIELKDGKIVAKKSTKGWIFKPA